MSVSIQQASLNAIADFLTPLMPGTDVTSCWPSPEKELPNRAVTIITAGARRDIPIEMKMLSKTDDGATHSARYLGSLGFRSRRHDG